MQRRDILNALAVASAAFPIARICEAAPPPTRPTVSAIRPAAAPYIESHDGTRLYWTQWGSGRPILWLNSFGLTTQMWEYQMVAFADQGYRCIAFDRRGHGRSDMAVNGYDYDSFADDLAAVISALQLQDLTLVGHSMAGGEIVRYLARHGNARVTRIVLLAPTTPYLAHAADNPNGVPQSAFEALRAAWCKDFPKWVADNTAPFFVPESSPAMMQALAAQMMRLPLPVAIACNKAVTSTDFRADLTKISLPALVIHGDRDASAPLALTGKATAELISGCRLKVYQGAPHGLMYTHMEMLNEDILKFMRET